MTKRLDGKVALITGSGGGIGREHAKLLALEGAKVVVNDIGARDGADADTVVKEIVEAGGEAVANGDSATWSSADELVAHAIEAFGRVDILINNATFARFDDVWNYSEEWWDNTIEVNLKGYFATIRALTPHMAERGSGVIVNTSSNSGFGHPSHAPYAAAKEGVVGSDPHGGPRARPFRYPVQRHPSDRRGGVSGRLRGAHEEVGRAPGAHVPRSDLGRESSDGHQPGRAAST